jgi:beta-phosphoglucomutase-like phosphatase (HAD superfamily)
MKLKLPEGPFKAYLFDCDGTLADSMPLHYLAWKKALAEWNCEFDERLFYQWGGMPVAEIVATLNQTHGLSMPVESVSRRKENHYFELLPQLKAVAEVLEHVEAEHKRIPFAVVSGSTRESVVASLQALGLARSFRHAGLRGRLQKKQARSRSFSACRLAPRSSARTLSGF